MNRTDKNPAFMGPGSSDTSVSVSMPVPRYWALIPFSNQRNQGSLEIRLILGIGQVLYKMSLEQLVAPESEEVPPKQNDGDM